MVKLEKVEKTWNKIVGALQKAAELHGEFKQQLSVLNSTTDLTIKGQELFGLATVMSEFTVFVERMTRFAYINGGLSYLEIHEPLKGSLNDPDEETKEEENEDE